MSSRVQKGNTVFRPVAKARSRAPTATPSQSSPTHYDPVPTPEVTQAFSSTMSLPIPSTAVPGREPPKQAVPPRPEPAHIIPQPPQNVVHENYFLNQAMDFSREASTSQPTHALVTPSSFPPAFLSVGRSTTEPLNVINVPTRQNSRPPMNTGHSYHGLPAGQPGPSHHDATFLTPSGSAPTEITNTLIPTPSYIHPQDTPAPSSVSQTQVQGQLGETFKRKRKSSRPRSESEPEEGPSTRGAMSRSNTPHQQRSRGPSLPPYDFNADPGEDIDPTMVTMAALCSDTGHGRVSSKAAEILSNHAAWKARNKERRARMRAAMEAKKYGRTADDEVEDRPSNRSPEREIQDPNNASSSAGPSTLTADSETGIDYSQQMQTSRYNVQVRIGANGETVIDEDSLVVDRTENEDISNYTHVVESDHTKFVNSGTYGKRYRGSRWSAEETELFYNALSQYGENYELIAYVLPGRDRKSCKNKFKAEDKKNHARINYCLNNRIPVDMKTLERMTGKDFSGPVPEIRAPPPPQIVQPEPTRQSENAEDSSTQKAPTKQVKKRSRSRTAGPEDGVVIVGDIDSIHPNADS